MKLIMSQAILSVNHKVNMEGEDGKTAYTVKTGPLSLRDKTVIETAKGSEVATITKKLISKHEVHFIELAHGKTLRLSDKAIDVGLEDFVIDGNDWSVKGKLADHEYKIRNKEGKTAAEIHKKLLSVRDKYIIEIQDEKNADMIVAIVIAMEHLIRDRKK